MSQQHPKVSKAKSRLIIEHPFFATLLLRTPILVQDHSTGGLSVVAAATDGEHIYLNPDFLEKCSVEDVMSTLVHEAGHDSLLHSYRLGHRNPDLANKAMDHAINLMLEDQGFAPPKPLPGGWLADKKYLGMNWERIYDDMRRNQPPPQGGGKGGGSGSGSQDTGKSGKSGKSGASSQGAPGGGSTKTPRDCLHGDVLPSPVANDPAAQAAAEQRARQRVAAAATAARMAGRLTGELARMVGEMLDAKVHWTDILREYMTRIVKTRDNWSRRNRRFANLYLPTRRSQQMGPIIFIPDTSGSMFGEDMEKICSEMAHCSQQTNPENIRVIWADAAVKGEQVFTTGEFGFDKLEPVGGGGTDMRVPLKYAEQYDPQIVVLLTDCYTPWPDEPCPFPVICISTTTAACPDWMERIEI
jgi:predicted metal-dependent peptidase